LERRFAKSEVACDVHETAPGEALPDLVREALSQGYDLVVAGGGDGTVSAVANGLVGSETPLGIVPLGTANVLARELGIPVDLEAACQLLGDASSAFVSIDAMRVDDRCYFTQVGVGIDAIMIRDTHREAKRRFGRIAYLWTAFTRLLGFQPRHFALVIDDRPIRQSASEVLIANSGILGQPPLRWGPGIRPDDGQLDVCLVRARTIRHYLSVAGHFLLGQHAKSPNVRYLTVRKSVSIATPRPLPVQADGEIIGETPVLVHVIPQALRVVVPAQAPQTLSQGT